jgi:cis-zeatin O-glucosyltransferase
VTPAEAIREVIEKVMARDEGLAVRDRAKELMESIRASLAEGGSSRKDLDDFVAYIAR